MKEASIRQHDTESSLGGAGVQAAEAAPAQFGGAVGAVLELQRAAGNRAVGSLLSRRQRAPVRLLQRWQDQPSAQAVLDALETASVDELRGMLAALDHPAVTDGRVAMQLPGLSTGIAVADATLLRQRVAEKLAHRLMGELASARAPAVANMETLSGAARRQAMNDLHTAEVPRLAELRSLTGGEPNRWRHPDPIVEDAILAAIQLEAVYRAEGQLGHVTEAHTAAAAACGMSITDDWCGFFVATGFMQSGLDQDLRAGFFHTENVVDYFRYDYARVNLSRIKKWIWAEEAWHDIRTYHEQRGSVRQWIDAQGISSSGGAGLDIRSGDVALIDNRGTERPDHIVMVDSYDPTRHALFTIGGNDSGYTIDPNPAHPAPAHESAADQAKRQSLEEGTGQQLTPGTGAGVGFGVQDLGAQPAPGPIDASHGASGRPRARVFGVGRPSVVDFENHYYDATSVQHPPAAAPAAH